jgi:chaperonin GroES
MENFRPLLDRVSIKRFAPDEKSAGGILLPKVAQDDQKIGTVLATGEGRTLLDGRVIEPPVKAGDIVVFPKVAGFDLDEKEGIVVIRSDEILGVLDPE